MTTVYMHNNFFCSQGNITMHSFVLSSRLVSTDRFMKSLHLFVCYPRLTWFPALGNYMLKTISYMIFLRFFYECTHLIIHMKKLDMIRWLMLRAFLLQNPWTQDLTVCVSKKEDEVSWIPWLFQMGANSFQECYVREWESLVFFSNKFHSLGCRCGVVGKQRMEPGGASVAFCSHQVGTWWSFHGAVDLKMNPWSTARLFC